MRKHQTARFVAILIIVMAFICLLGGLAASLLVSRVGLGAGWGSGSKAVLLLPVILGSFLTFVAMLLLGAILFFLVEIDNNLSALRGRIPKAAAPAETALPTPEETMPEAPATVPAVVPGGVPALSYDEAMARVRAREAVIAASAGATAPAVAAGPAGGGGVGLAGAALAVAAVAAVAGHEGGETKPTEAAREVEVTLPAAAAVAGVAAAVAAPEAAPEADLGVAEAAAVEAVPSEAATEVEAVPSEAEAATAVEAGTAAGGGIGLAGAALAVAGVAAVAGHEGGETKPPEAEREVELTLPAVAAVAGVAAAVAAPEAAPEADLGVAEEAAVEAVTSGEATVEAVPSEAGTAVEAVPSEVEAAVEGAAAGAEEAVVAPAVEAMAMAPEALPGIEAGAAGVAPAVIAEGAGAGLAGAALAVAGVAAVAGHEGGETKDTEPMAVAEAPVPAAEAEVPIPAVAAAIAAARVAASREVEAVGEVPTEAPGTTDPVAEATGLAIAEVEEGTAGAPSVEVTALEPSTAELVARSLAQEPTPSEPAVAEAVTAPGPEAGAVAAELATPVRELEVAAGAPLVEISELVAGAPGDAALTGGVTAVGLAAVAQHARADAEEAIGEGAAAEPVETVEAGAPVVAAEAPEVAVLPVAPDVHAEAVVAEGDVAETVDAGPDLAVGVVEAAPVQPEAPADEELSQLRSQFAELEAGISGLEEARPAPRLPGSAEAARIAAEMAALKPAPLAAPAKEGRERKPAKLTSRLTYVEGIGEESAAKLEEIGIGTPEALLARGATLKGRQEIAEQSGLSDKLILKWVNHADMFRVSGIGSEYADLLEAAGVDTVVELASRVPANLHAKLVATNQEKKLVRQMPVLWQVERWVALAKALPRVVTY